MSDENEGLNVPVEYRAEVQEALLYSDSNRQPCPHCGQELTGREVRMGKCKQCGKPVDHASTGHADTLEGDGA